MPAEPKQTDPALLEALEGRTPRPRGNDAHAQRIAELFGRYHGRLVRSLAARTRSWDEARDIAAQAFVELLALQRPASVGFFGAYLYRTARNLATNHLIRRTMRHHKEPVAGYEPTRSIPSPEPLLLEQQRRAVLQRVIAELPANWRMALVLRVWDELSYEEIVARFADKGVELTARTVRRYFSAALQQCRYEMLAAEDPSKKAGA